MGAQDRFMVQIYRYQLEEVLKNWIQKSNQILRRTSRQFTETQARYNCLASETNKYYKVGCLNTLDIFDNLDFNLIHIV